MKPRPMRLFVYGSLMSGEPAHDLVAALAGARCIGRGWICGRMLDLGEYPGVLRDAADGETVRGEVWEFDSDPQALRKLDAYEGCDAAPDVGQFTRRRTSVHVTTGTIHAWAYFLTRHPAHETVVRGGDWRRRRADGARR